MQINLNRKTLLLSLIIFIAALLAFGATAGYSSLSYFATKALLLQFGFVLDGFGHAVCYLSTGVSFLYYALTKGYSIFVNFPIKVNVLLHPHTRARFVEDDSDFSKTATLIGTFTSFVHAFFSGLGSLLGMVSIGSPFYLAAVVGACTFACSSLFGTETINRNLRKFTKQFINHAKSELQHV